jgi:hypothetical protein
MKTIQQVDAQHGQGDRGSGCCGGPGRRDQDTPMDRRRALEEHQRDLEQELADVAQQLGDLPPDEPSASE